MTAIRLSAPAKVNLFLKVLNKRKDSYHNICTLFERIAIEDGIRISRIPRGIVVTSDKKITARAEDNIAYKAAGLMMRYARIKSGVEIRIRKNIPIGAGLGGGSSDAASVLVGMNRLFGLKMKSPVLMRLGAQLGADVPFFLMDKPFALGTGKGEALTRVDLEPGLWHLLIYPNFKISTKEAYEAFDLASASRHRSVSSAEPLPKCLTTKGPNVKIHLPLKRAMDIEILEDALHNDLEEIVVAKHPVIGGIIGRLASLLGKKAIVSGSGPSVFCLYETRREVTKARDGFLAGTPASQRKRWQIFAVKTKG